FFFSSRRRHTRSKRDWSSDVCSSDLADPIIEFVASPHRLLATEIGLVTNPRKVIVHIATSADGYIARSDGDLEWLTSRPAPKGRSEERRVGQGRRCRRGRDARIERVR